MKRPKFLLLCAAVSTLIFAVPGWAASLPKVGDRPAALSVDAWLKGDPVKQFDSGQAYLVEFWGTWCGPCIENIPHLTALQNRHRDQGLIVIGVASHEFKGGIEQVRDFVAKQGDRMAYRIAYDGDLSMEKAWQTGGDTAIIFRMPEAYLIDRGGHIAWIGHPADTTMDAAVAAAVNTAKGTSSAAKSGKPE